MRLRREGLRGLHRAACHEQKAERDRGPLHGVPTVAELTVGGGSKPRKCVILRTMRRLLLPCVAAVVFSSGIAAESTDVLPQGSQLVPIAASKAARDEAGKLLADWVHIAGP